MQFIAGGKGPAHNVVGRIAAKKRVVGDTPHGGGKYQECGWAVATEWLAVGVILDDDDDDRQCPTMRELSPIPRISMLA